MNEFTIDATNKRMGRVATEAATILMGKHLPTYQKNLAGQDRVRIINASRILIEERKKEGKIYKSFSGYPSGLKKATLSEVVKKSGYGLLFNKIISGMLPHNRLKRDRLKRLTITE